ncbi:MAG TPA: 50S ribosomal protein L18e [Nitrososphaera sp.]|nr:50S ribosomal protein L18e [Nitrososphaera sp.]
MGNFEYEFLLHMFAQTVIDNTIWTLRNAFKRNKAPIWRALQEELAGPRANRREINVRRLAQITKADEVVVVPGKVLGTGSLGHKLTVCAFSISETAAKKIIESGGTVLTFDDLINKHPDGKGVRIIG